MKVLTRQRRLPKTVVIALLACCLASLSCRSESDRKGPVATVNGKPISAKAFFAELRRRQGRRALDELIRDVLIRQRAAQLHLDVTDEDVNRAWSEAVAHAGSEADLRRRLKRTGISDAEFRRQLRLDALLDKIVARSVEVTPEEIRSYYAEHKDEFRLGERVRVRFMMLENKRNAQEIRAVLDQPGADFAGLAKAFSIDPATRDKGGDTGYFERGHYFAKPIEDVAFSLKRNEISPVFKGPDGWCILQLVDRKPPEIQPLSEVENQIRSRLLFLKRQRAKETWYAEAKEKADIRILADDLKPIPPDKLAPR